MRYYFDREEVSNSELKTLARAYRSEDDPFGDNIQAAFNFGSLIDALRTAPHLLRGNRLYNDDLETFVTLSNEELDRGHALNRYLDKDPLLKLFADTMIGQFVFIRQLVFDWEGEVYRIRSRCKFDHFTARQHWPRMKIGVDYKTTVATNGKQFIAAIEFFSWDQGAAYYMDIAKIDYFWLIGICKSKNEIFKFAIKRGDETYLRGRAKYSRWAYAWATLIDPFVASISIQKPLTLQS